MTLAERLARGPQPVPPTTTTTTTRETPALPEWRRRVLEESQGRRWVARRPTGDTTR